jgi:hypothetical protein
MAVLIALTAVWVIAWSIMFHSDRVARRKHRRGYGPEYDKVTRAMRLEAWMILLTPIWPAVASFWIAHFFILFVGDVVKAAVGGVRK